MPLFFTLFVFLSEKDEKLFLHPIILGGRSLAALLPQSMGIPNDIRLRTIRPVIPFGSTLVINNKNGSLKITSKSLHKRLVEFGGLTKEVDIDELDWGRNGTEGLVIPIASGYMNAGFGSLGRGGITRVVYEEYTLIFNSKEERDTYMNYPYQRNQYDMQSYPRDVRAGFFTDLSREQLGISVLKLEVREPR